MSDEPKINLCLCGAFVLWYVDDDGPPLPVCWCGHPDGEHLDGARSCVGKIRILPATSTGGQP